MLGHTSQRPARQNRLICQRFDTSAQSQTTFLEVGIQLFSVSHSTTVDDLINAQGIYLILGVQAGVFNR